MGTFNASLRAIGDVKALPATVVLSDGTLTIAAGDTEIGSWALGDIHLEEIPTGYRMSAEGEQIIIELKDATGFAAELASGKKKRLSFGRKKQARVEEPGAAPEPEARPIPSRAPVEVEEGSGRATPRLPKREAAKKRSGWTQRGLALVDGTLEKANKKLGPYLPEWMFTRAMFAIAFGALVLMLALPGLVSTFLLIVGALMVMFGAVVYSDTMLASRWLPGRTTPQHVLLFGVAILMMGVLLGLIAR